MIQTHPNLANAAYIIVLLLYLQAAYLEAGSGSLCPIGYQIAVNSDGDPTCFQKKGPETFADKFENCAGNLYTLELLHSLNITLPTGQSIWTDYKNLYDGGPFVDWTGAWTGDILASTYEVTRDSLYNVNDELCVVMDPVTNFTAVRCDEKHYRYCFLETYPDDPSDITTNYNCHDLTNPVDPDNPFDYVDPDTKIEKSTFWFSSPSPSCLLKVDKVRMTWNQSQRACRAKGGSLLNRGWIYSNFPIFSTKDDLVFPFGVRASANLSLLRYDAEHDSALIPSSQWMFKSTITNNDTRLGAVIDDSWDMVNSSYIFYDVLCEKTIPLRHVNLTVFIDADDEDRIVLTLNDTDLNVNDIHCFTDSTRYYPQKVKLIKRVRKPDYFLKFSEDGYYWCTHSDSRNFYISESNKVLRIKVKADIVTLYAIKLTALAHDYTLADMKLVTKDWKKKIEEYVTYTTKYIIKTHDSDYDNQTIWNYKNSRPDMDIKNIDVKLKRIYLNSRTALLHVKLHTNMLPVKALQWDDIQIEFMKPAYYCQRPDPATTVTGLALGETFRESSCKIYKCIGDFNEGVQLVITANTTCTADTAASTTISVVEQVSDVMPDAIRHITTDSTTAATSKLGNLEQNNSDSSSEEEKDKPIKTTEAYSSTVVLDTTISPETTETQMSYVTSVPLRPPISWPPVVETTTPTTPVVTATPEIPPGLITTPRPPSEQLDQVVQNLETLLNNSEPVLVADVNESFDQMDLLMSEDTEDLDIPSHFLHLLDQLGSKLYLNGAPEGWQVRENLALVVADADPAVPVRGLRIAARENDSFVPDAFEIIRDDINNTQLEADTNEVVVSLPESVATTNRRISFVVFRNDRAFRNSNGLYSVNSRVLSVNVENTTHFNDGEVIEIHMSPLNETQRNESRSCAYWEFLKDGSGGFWSQEGCTFVRATTPGMLDTCRCDHLTHFAEVLVPRTVFSENNERVLEVISVVGCFMSIFGLICVGVTALMFRAWRRDYSNKIWLQLCISIFILSIAFIVVIYAHFEEYNFMCMFTGIILHYSVLSSFCWMLVAAVLSYRRLVTVFTRDASHKLLRASAFAWGLPCAVVGILLSIAPHSYSGRFDEKNPSTAFCYPSGLALWLSVYGPIALMLLVNWTLFALIVRSVFASRRNHPNRVGSRHSSDRNEALRCASVSFFLVFLFGLPWLFGLFAMNVVMAYIFVLLTTFQGFVLFLFFVLGNKKTRDLWLNKLKIKQTKKIPVTSSTYTNNRSTTGNANSRGVNPAQTIEAKVSRPKSLNSLDNSRFS